MRRPIVAGIAIGLPASWATSRMAQALFFDVTPLDAGTYFLAIVVLIGVAGVAAGLPMRRAASLNPADVLHQQVLPPARRPHRQHRGLTEAFGT